MVFHFIHGDKFCHSFPMCSISLGFIVLAMLRACPNCFWTRQKAKFQMRAGSVWMTFLPKTCYFSDDLSSQKTQVDTQKKASYEYQVISYWLIQSFMTVFEHVGGRNFRQKLVSDSFRQWQWQGKEYHLTSIQSFSPFVHKVASTFCS